MVPLVWTSCLGRGQCVSIKRPQERPLSDHPKPSDLGEHDERRTRAPRWVRLFWGAVALAIVAVLIIHAAGGGLGGHG
jgi:hypothetical protein